MTTYQITYTYTGDIVQEIDADTIEDALARVADPGSGYTAIVAGVEVDMHRTSNPRVTVKRGDR